MNNARKVRAGWRSRSRGRFVLLDPRRQLAQIADYLNRRPDVDYLAGRRPIGKSNSLWDWATQLVTECCRHAAQVPKGPGIRRRLPVPPRVVRRFNELAVGSPVRLVLAEALIGGRHRVTWPGVDWLDVPGFVVRLLWFDYFQNPEWPRLKKCEYPPCGHWFVDATRNLSARRCSARCTNRTWNRGRRRTAGQRMSKGQRRSRRQ
ncbi:MAG: CGNR zinc finger domain-containing protein [Candidatus Rokubacteria bacterium]|nr:CGNR zinc finger domain-containing protein [Candidatus Rokubacteria bacterium]